MNERIEQRPVEQQTPDDENRAPTERVYAPASERVAKPPAPGHESLIKEVDESTPERQAASQG